MQRGAVRNNYADILTTKKKGIRRMEPVYIYTGCFIPNNTLLSSLSGLNRVPLARQIQNPHVTFSYKPQSVDTALFGEPINIRVVAYGNDGNNEGLRVEVFSDNPAIMNMIQQISVPHITLSVRESGKPVNTASLAFRPIEPFTLQGRYGTYTADGNIVTN